MHTTILKPTAETYDAFQTAYAHFNASLFGGLLGSALITLARKKGTNGYFHGDRFAAYEDSTVKSDEIALNPDHFKSRTTSEVLSTLVHEMVHLWQHHHGKPSRIAYHNKEWADKMESLGLIPSDTGQVGGKRTGQKVSHYIQHEGPFERACLDLLAKGFSLKWYSHPEAGKAKASKSGKRIKFICSDCSAAAWAKPDSQLHCGVPDCHNAPMLPAT